MKHSRQQSASSSIIQRANIAWMDMLAAREVLMGFASNIHDYFSTDSLAATAATTAIEPPCNEKWSCMDAAGAKGAAATAAANTAVFNIKKEVAAAIDLFLTAAVKSADLDDNAMSLKQEWVHALDAFAKEKLAWTTIDMSNSVVDYWRESALQWNRYKGSVGDNHWNGMHATAARTARDKAINQILQIIEAWKAINASEVAFQTLKAAREKVYPEDDQPKFLKEIVSVDEDHDEL